ncbi:creatininase family protein [Ornithinicoccus halotolerans]|uniref:creatininase family protein n=1 Tax=Ornithinicoccus halotolerans TaxID=1748220 RepID=UPI0012968878|nr:creatininase family protein [Ornithinicoccus halotolerans]
MSDLGRGADTGSRYAALTSTEHAAESRVVLVPVGAVEQHGPHLPVGTDIWIATAVATEVATSRADVLVLEPVPFGVSGHHMSFAGTVSLRPSTYLALVADVVTSVARHGDVPVLINGHGGNRGPLTVALQELVETNTRAWALSYFEHIADVVREVFPRHETAVGHACALETSVVAHLWPGLLRAEAIPGPGARGVWPAPFLYSTDKVERPRRFEELDSSGVVGEPGLQSAEAGRRLFLAAVERVGEVIDRIPRASRPDPAAPAAGE